MTYAHWAAAVLFLATQYQVGCDCAGAMSSSADAGGEPSSDAGMSDAGMSDAGMSDAGMSDAGMSDAGMSDAGTSDGGTSDGGTSDGGTSDGGTSNGTSAVQALGGGYLHGCRIVGGRVSCWGTASSGALGVGDTMPRDVPTSVATDASFASLSAGGASSGLGSSCALDPEGDVWCWGNDTYGQLCQGALGAARNVPTRVVLPVKVRAIAESHFETYCILGRDGSLWCWGSNLEGQLTFGDGGLASRMPSPVRVEPFTDWAHASAGQGHACAVRGNGEAWCWGRNTLSELGAGPNLGGQLRVPQRVASDAGFSRISAGQNHTCAIADGRLVCWGDLSHQGDPEVSVPLDHDAGARWVEVSTNTFHSCAVDDRRDLYCWGRNDEGQLCLGDNTLRARPTRVTGGDWSTVVTLRFSTCAQKTDGGTFCCGENLSYAIGIGAVPMRTNVPTQQPP